MMKGGRSRDVRIKEILKETILALLNNGVEFTSELQVDGLLGVTVDQNDVFLVRINEIVPSLKRQLGGHDSEPHHGDSSEEETAPKSAPPQQSKAQRRKRRSPSPKQSASGKNEKRARTTSPTQAIPSSTSTKDVKSEGGTDYGAVDIDLTNVKMEPVDTTVADSNNSGDFDFSNRQQLNHPAVITSIQSVAESEWQGGQQQQQQQQQEMANAQLQQQDGTMSSTHHRLIRTSRRRRCRDCYRAGVRRDVSTVCTDCPTQQGDGIPYCPAHFMHQHKLYSLHGIYADSSRDESLDASQADANSLDNISSDFVLPTFGNLSGLSSEGGIDFTKGNLQRLLGNSAGENPSTHDVKPETYL